MSNANAAARHTTSMQSVRSQGSESWSVAPDEGPDFLWKQQRSRQTYESKRVQGVVATLILTNFFVSATQAQLRPNGGTLGARVFDALNAAFAVVFAAELSWNMYSSWFSYFWVGPDRWWNVFDFVVVFCSVLSLVFSDLPGVAVLRLLRAFRAIRLFRRISSLRIITEGVMAALPGVGNAFVVLAIVMGIWSILGVEFFAKYADQEFGTFLKAMFTMWQVMTRDGWSSTIARRLIFTHDLPLASLFFVSFIFIAGIVITNVVIAILLERYLTKVKEEEMKAEATTRLELLFQGDGGDRLQLVRLIGDSFSSPRLAKLAPWQLKSLLDHLWTVPDSRVVLQKLLTASLQAEKRDLDPQLVRLLGQT